VSYEELEATIFPKVNLPACLPVRQVRPAGQPR